MAGIDKPPGNTQRGIYKKRERLVKEALPIVLETAPIKENHGIRCPLARSEKKYFGSRAKSRPAKETKGKPLQHELNQERLKKVS